MLYETNNRERSREKGKEDGQDGRLRGGVVEDGREGVWGEGHGMDLKGGFI